MSSSPNKKQRLSTRSSNLPTRNRQVIRDGNLSIRLDIADEGRNVGEHLPMLQGGPESNIVTSSIQSNTVDVNKEEELVIDISSDEGNQADDFSLMPANNISDVKIKIEPGLESPDRSDTVVRTRSTSGIIKKRFLKDAAILSEDDELPLSVLPPKKSRATVGRTVGRDLAETGMPIEDQLPTTPVRRRVASKQQISFVPSDAGAGQSLETARLTGSSSSTKGTPIDKGKLKALNLMPAFEDDDDKGDIDESEIDYMKTIADGLRFLKKYQASMGSTSAKALTSEVINADKETVSLDVSKDVSQGNNSIAHTDDAVVPLSDQAENIRSVSVPADVKPRRTFKDVFPETQTTPMLSGGTDFFDTTMMFKVMSLPRVCEVSDINLQEPLFIDEYASLPPLRSGSLKPWASNAPPIDTKLVNFRQWATQCPDMDFDAAKNALFFTRYKNFINPSRVDPREVNILYTQADHKRSVLQCNYKTAICLTPILVADSHLIEPVSDGLMTKYISGYFHNQEWQRFEGFCCMVFNRPSMTVQTQNNNLAFLTMGPRQGGRDYGQYNSPSKIPRNPGILGSAASKKPDSTSKDESSQSRFGSKTILNYTDDVPIYDAREHVFNFASDLDELEYVLPRYNSELPQHSFAVVAYTLGCYEKDRRVHLATNIMFAILFGTE